MAERVLMILVDGKVVLGKRGDNIRDNDTNLTVNVV